jgi:hypothetical protein
MPVEKAAFIRKLLTMLRGVFFSKQSVIEQFASYQQTNTLIININI